MKQHHSRGCVRNQPAYPNAADPGYFSKKAMEILTGIISGFSMVSAMIFLVILA